MIGDDQKIEWTVKACLLTMRRNNGSALGEAVGLVRIEGYAKAVGVLRELGMEMGVSPEKRSREVFSGRRRVRRSV